VTDDGRLTTRKIAIVLRRSAVARQRSLKIQYRLSVVNTNWQGPVPRESRAGRRAEPLMRCSPLFPFSGSSQRRPKIILPAVVCSTLVTRNVGILANQLAGVIDDNHGAVVKVSHPLIVFLASFRMNTRIASPVAPPASTRLRAH